MTADVFPVEMDAGSRFSRTVDAVVAHALCGVPQSADPALPIIDFLSHPAGLDPACASVPPEIRGATRRAVTAAFLWCAARFPLVTAPDAEGVRHGAIRHLDVRRTPDGELLGSSSPGTPGCVVLGASWPVGPVYRLASLLAHESVHQALFVREAVADPVRPGSFGYSPWRRTIRPGRAIWHAFWTFAAQFALLADAVAENADILDEDPGLLGFLAELFPRIELCLDSLHQFTVVDAAETRRCDRAFLATRKAVARLSAFPLFGPALSDETAAVDADYRYWVAQVTGN